MAGNLFKQAAAYRKKHKGMTMQAAVKACAKKASPKKKPAARKKAAPKKHAHKVGAVKKKQKFKIHSRKGTTRITIGGISGISLAKVKTELHHQQGLQGALKKHQAMLKTKGLSKTDNAQIRRDIAHYRSAIASSKKHVSALKRSI